MLARNSDLASVAATACSLADEEVRFGLLAIGDVFGHVEEILRISSGVPDDRKIPLCNDDASIAANEALLPLVIVVFALEEFRVAFRAGGTLVRVDDLVPFLH